MTAPIQENQAQPQDSKQNDKEYNFRNLERKYQQEMAQERAARAEAERKAKEFEEKLFQNQMQEDDDNEPYVDKKKFKRELANFGEQTKKQTQSEIQTAVQQALQEERKQNWVKQNPDFYETLQHAEKLLMHQPELAESILAMPESFERQKLVYKNIKALGLDKPIQKEPSIQEKIDANRKAPYYQPSGIANSPYSAAGDFSAKGQETAYAKMQELKNRLRL